MERRDIKSSPIVAAHFRKEKVKYTPDLEKEVDMIMSQVIKDIKEGWTIFFDYQPDNNVVKALELVGLTIRCQDEDLIVSWS